MFILNLHFNGSRDGGFLLPKGYNRGILNHDGYIVSVGRCELDEFRDQIIPKYSDSTGAGPR